MFKKSIVFAAAVLASASISAGEHPGAGPVALSDADLDRVTAGDLSAIVTVGGFAQGSKLAGTYATTQTTVSAVQGYSGVPQYTAGVAVVSGTAVAQTNPGGTTAVAADYSVSMSGGGDTYGGIRTSYWDGMLFDVANVSGMQVQMPYRPDHSL